MEGIESDGAQSIVVLHLIEVNLSVTIKQKITSLVNFYFKTKVRRAIDSLLPCFVPFFYAPRLS